MNVSKEIHYANGSSKIIWAWAGVSTLLVIGMFGFFARIQWETNENLKVAVTNLGERVGRLELQIGYLQDTIERLE
jgi:hypothetical protein